MDNFKVVCTYLGFTQHISYLYDLCIIVPTQHPKSILTHCNFEVIIALYASIRVLKPSQFLIIQILVQYYRCTIILVSLNLEWYLSNCKSHRVQRETILLIQNSRDSCFYLVCDIWMQSNIYPLWLFNISAFYKRFTHYIFISVLFKQNGICYFSNGLLVNSQIYNQVLVIVQYITNILILLRTRQKQLQESAHVESEKLISIKTISDKIIQILQNSLVNIQYSNLIRNGYPYSREDQSKFADCANS
ncbi:Hypothetical_protein [Hexamita inflata]|uniref:Hypothetical_protein n=1 Tax=Hexamita inflata TaxID=28002 RepID=A0AA86QV50_9EUKA|nr:Hypothetical protein HINF_LOCUS54261 [Hexamita inflata]